MKTATYAVVIFHPSTKKGQCFTSPVPPRYNTTQQMAELYGLLGAIAHMNRTAFKRYRLIGDNEGDLLAIISGKTRACDWTRATLMMRITAHFIKFNPQPIVGWIDGNAMPADSLSRAPLPPGLHPIPPSVLADVLRILSHPNCVHRPGWKRTEQATPLTPLPRESLLAIFHDYYD
jgi:hypothetical protein